MQGSEPQRLEHLRLPLADCKAADGIAFEADVFERRGRIRPQVRKDTALHNTEKAIAFTLPECIGRALGPAHGEMHALGRLRVRGGVRRAFVEGHGDRCIQHMLNFNGALRRQHMIAAVNMRAKAHAFFGHLAQLSQTHDLETAGIRQDRAWPIHELAYPAMPRNQLRSRAQHQVVGISENNLRPGGAYILWPHRFDRRSSAHRHEDRCLDGAMGCRYAPAAGRAGCGEEIE